MRIREFLLGGLLLGAFIIGFGLFANDFGAQNNVQISNQANLSTIAKIQEIANSTQNTVRQSSITGTPLDPFLAITSSVFIVLKVALTDLPDLWTKMFSDIGTAIGIPSILISFAVLAVAIIIVFEVIKAITYRDV